MKLKSTVLIAAILLVVGAVAPDAVADIPDTTQSTSHSAGGVVFVTPAGNGNTLESVGATVIITVLDVAGLPWPNYPAQDVFLGPPQWSTSNLAVCHQGSIADGPSDANGRTTISGVIAGGGYSPTTTVYIANTPLTQPDMNVAFTSPDINGDLAVDLEDFSVFGIDFGSDEFRSDFNADGTVDLADFSTFGICFGEACP